MFKLKVATVVILVAVLVVVAPPVRAQEADKSELI